MKEAARGKLIVVCGIDGSGKTTQEELLAKTLRAQGMGVLCTHQPSDWYRDLPEVRAYLDTGETSLSVETIALLAAADRMIHVDSTIKPALEAGVHVICNRYVYSSYGYFKARGADPDFVAAINATVPEPDVGVFLRVEPTVAVKRVLDRGSKRKFEETSAEYLAVVQTEMLRTWPRRFLTLDGGRCIEETAAAIASFVLSRLDEGG